MSSTLSRVEHLFIAPGAVTLPAWKEAFAHLRVVSMDSLPKAPLAASMIWLRLDHLTGLNGHVADLHARFGPVPVVILADTPNDSEALAALSAQARGYCNTHAGAEVLTKVASVVEQGGLWIGETLMHRILSVQQHIKVPDNPLRSDWRTRLTAREVEVAELAAAGTRYKEIARELLITERTVKSHMATILEKLGLRDRLQLALLASERQSTEIVTS
ncbi:MAG: response regulator transcription factor [Massilia sp.]